MQLYDDKLAVAASIIWSYQHAGDGHAEKLPVVWQKCKKRVEGRACRIVSCC